MERTCGFTGDWASGYALWVGAALWGFWKMGSSLMFKELITRASIKQGKSFLFRFRR